jgi:hypothetical protein
MGCTGAFTVFDCMLYSNFEEKKVLIQPYFKGDIFYVL